MPGGFSAALSDGGALAGWPVAPPGGGGLRVIESAVAKRGEDPMPGVRELLAVARSVARGRRLRRDSAGLGTARTPSTPSLKPLPTVSGSRPSSVPVDWPPELFPTPVELAAVICACRDRGLPFKLTQGCTERYGTTIQERD